MKMVSPAKPCCIGLNLVRGAALFLGLFTSAALVVSVVRSGFDPNLWWIDLRALPTPMARVALGLAGLVLIQFALCPPRSPAGRVASSLVLGAFVALASWNAEVCWRLSTQHRISSPVWVPLSILFAALLASIGWHVLRGSRSPRRMGWIATGFLLCISLFPLLQVFGFGKTSYARPADVAVVFGARVYADGRLSDAVADRVSTAAELYRRKMVGHLVMSGGPGDGAVHEAEAMSRRAVQLGVPADAISLDRQGVNTAATVRNTDRLAAVAGWRRVIVVSEFYHLPRIKLSYAATGTEVFTVPARPRHWARRWAPANVMREIPAFWAYLLRGALGRIQ